MALNWYVADCLAVHNVVFKDRDQIESDFTDGKYINKPRGTASKSFRRSIDVTPIFLFLFFTLLVTTESRIFGFSS